MDYNFEIIISKSDLNIIGLNEKKLFWGGEELSFIPREFFIDDTLRFIELTHGKIYDNLLNVTSIERPVIIAINRKYSSVESIINSDSIVKLFDNICSIRHFELYLWRDDESINAEYEYTDKNNVIAIMKKAIEDKENISFYLKMQNLK